ncbi:hypothetical protein Q3G72_020837 [Acer saccharum]|nr:hypothetical protein Q3G72_020837 [Acer saccharum]
MQLPSVAVYTPVDADAAHLYLADEVIALDAALGARGYLDGQALLVAARLSCATAIHPGYGFLSQSPQFATACAEAGVIFIGPSPAAMTSLGDKRRARQMAVAQAIPVIPGVEAIDGAVEAAQAAAKIGYPVLIKAAGGGGGKGMRRVAAPEDLSAALSAAAREAQHAFGDARLLLEKCIAPARHIEVQILGDGVQALALGERECSLQRRYQKIIEESPAQMLGGALRDSLQAAAVRLVAAAKYQGAATVEFLVDAAGAYYFLEVNTRLQVEHPVTELCRGIDLVQAQIELAHGQALTAIKSHAPWGHAIEARLNAENPQNSFMPSTGRIEALIWPQGPGIRVDAGIELGSQIGSDYDAMLAKIIAWAPTRALCRARLVAALQEMVILGVVTNQSFLLTLLQSEAFITNETYVTTVEDTKWPRIEAPQAVAALGQAVRDAPKMGGALAETTRASGADRYAPWERMSDGFCGGQHPRRHLAGLFGRGHVPRCANRPNGQPARAASSKESANRHPNSARPDGRTHRRAPWRCGRALQARRDAGGA